MARVSIHFFSEETEFKLHERMRLRSWVNRICRLHGFSVSELTFIFCSDEYLLSMNQQYLSHDTYTDVITFDNAVAPENGPGGKIFGDIFISVERVSENAAKLGIPFQDELHRVMIHGTLHLLGFKDKSSGEKLTMTAEEDRALAILKES